MKTLKTFSNHAEAGFAHSLLEAAGLHPFLANEHNISLGGWGAIEGIRLQIPEAEYEQALRVLAEGPDAEPPSGGNPAGTLTGMAAETPRASRGMPVGVFVAATAGAVVVWFAVRSVLPEWHTRTQATRVGDQVQTRDLNHDSKSDYFETYRDGHIVHAETDQNFDDKPDLWQFYGSDGLVERSESDSNFDGSTDSFATYHGGKLIHAEADRNFDGKIDEWQFYGSDGVLERSELDEDHDG